jgi:hypothetical protein
VAVFSNNEQKIPSNNNSNVNTLRYSTLLYATLRYSTLLYATLRYSTLLYATLRYSTQLGMLALIWHAVGAVGATAPFFK